MSVHANFHPFAEVATIRKSSSQYVKFFDLENPIPAEVTDPQELRQFFIDFPFIPYAGYDRQSAHTLLRKLMDFKHLSSTHGACIESKKTYCFGGMIDLVRASNGTFNIGTESDVPVALQQQYIEFLDRIDIGDGMDWRKLRECFSESIDTGGNEWLEIVLSETAGVKSAGIYHHEQDTCLYWKDKIDGIHHAAISQEWTYKYLNEFPVTLIPIFPNFAEMPDGTLRSLHHVRNTKKLYGRPPAYAALCDMYTEFKNAVYLAKIANKGFVADKIIEVPGKEAGGLVDSKAAKQAGFRNAAHRIEHNFSNVGGNPSSSIVMSRQTGQDPIKVHELKSNMKESYFEKIDKLLSKKIARANDWALVLLDFDSASGFSNTMYKDVFNIKSVTTINTRQRLVDSNLNGLVHFIARWMQREELTTVSQKSVSPIQKLLDEFDEQQNSDRPDGGTADA